MAEYDASDPKQVKEKRIEADSASRDRRDMIAAVIDLRQGRDWIWSILTMTGVYHNPFRVDPYQTAFRAGEMNIGQQILADVIAASPEKYALMVREQKELEDVRSAKPRHDSPDRAAADGDEAG